MWWRLPALAKVGFVGPKKSDTPMLPVWWLEQFFEKVKDLGIKELKIFVKGVGTGRDSAVRALSGLGFNVVSVQDTTPIPHNGCRAAKARRV